MFGSKVLQAIASTGATPYRLSGTPVGSWKSWRSRFDNGAPVFYSAQNPTGTIWETGWGILTHATPDTISRNLLSSSTGSLIEWNASDGQVVVFSAPAEVVLNAIVNGGLAADRPFWLQFGLWWKQDYPSSGVSTPLVFDGTDDVPLGIVPTGAVMPFAGAAAPLGWLLCQGQAISRITYAALFEVIGTTYGVGDGLTTFNAPDLGGRVVAGKEASATRLTTAASGIDGDTLGATGGAEAVALVATNLPELLVPAGTGVPGSQSPRSVFGDGTNVGTIPVAGTNPGGTGVAHANAQPTIVLNYIIKT